MNAMSAIKLIADQILLRARNASNQPTAAPFAWIALQPPPSVCRLTVFRACNNPLTAETSCRNNLRGCVQGCACRILHQRRMGTLLQVPLMRTLDDFIMMRTVLFRRIQLGTASDGAARLQVQKSSYSSSFGQWLSTFWCWCATRNRELHHAPAPTADWLLEIAKSGRGVNRVLGRIIATERVPTRDKSCVRAVPTRRGGIRCRAPRVADLRTRLVLRSVRPPNAGVTVVSIGRASGCRSR